jgi:hypothetical protein
MEIRSKVRAAALRGGWLLAALAALAIIVNLSWFDEPLYPEIVRLEAPEPVSMDDNAYPLVYGFPAADDRDPLEAGLAIVAQLREQYRQGRPIGLRDEQMAELLGGANLDASWQAGFESLPCNSRLQVDCADGLIADVAHGKARNARLALLRSRYERILAASRFEENQEFDVTTPVPAYGLLMTVGRIRLAQSYVHDETGTFLARAAEDIAFWRRMLRDGRTLIAKMVALAGIRNDLELISAAMRNGDLHAGDVEAIRRFLVPLTPEERDIGEAFLSEFRIALLSGKTVVLSPGEPSWLSPLFLQEQATLNEFYLTTVMPIRVRAALDAAAFYEQRGYEPLTYNLRVFPPPLYNLAGKLLLKRQARSYNVQGYLGRVHDVDGRIALVLLQAEIEQSSERGVADIVHASTHRNPYTGEPMRYDATSRTIGFECIAGNPNDVCAVSLGPAAR